MVGAFYHLHSGWIHLGHLMFWSVHVASTIRIPPFSLVDFRKNILNYHKEHRVSLKGLPLEWIPVHRMHLSGLVKSNYPKSKKHLWNSLSSITSQGTPGNRRWFNAPPWFKRLTLWLKGCLRSVNSTYSQAELSGEQPFFDMNRVSPASPFSQSTLSSGNALRNQSEQ